MSCPSELSWSLFVDGALAAADALPLTNHLRGCARCAALVSALETERSVLQQALAAGDEVVAAPPLAVVAPPARPVGARDALGLGAAAALAAWLVSVAWRGLAAAVPPEAAWLNPIDSGTAWDTFVDSVLFFSHEGHSMIASTVTFAGATVAALLFAWGLFAVLASRRGAPFALSLCIALAAGLPSPGHTLEVRRGEGLVSVPAGQTIADTLIVFGETIAIDGDVTGNLIAFARTINVRGTIGGSVVAAAQNVVIDGPVGGTVFAAGRGVDVLAGVGGDVFGAGNNVTIGNRSEIAGNATVAARYAALRGRIGGDLTSAASDLEISGEVVRNVRASTESTRVVANGRIGGDLRTRSVDPDNIEIAPGASVGGATDTQVVEGGEPRNRFMTASFYLGKVLWIGAAFVMGLLLLWLFPGLRTVDLDSPAQALKSAGVGFLTALALPVASVLLLVTLIGIPLGVLGFVLFALLLYSAKIVVAFLIGRRLFASPGGALPHHAAMLIAGLFIVAIAASLPLVGGPLSFALTLVGIGLIVDYALRARTERAEYVRAERDRGEDPYFDRGDHRF